ncbi:MAG: alpha amylase C-terminal domain-containing protein [Bacteroidales bacterium]|jgi:1,4-alpha-glucan branching enzyme|nr:alpha amylase C-terminal domain-containing protein [Bacteroidales bacterium]
MKAKLALTANDSYLLPYEKIILNRQQKTILRAFDFTLGEKKLSDCFNGHLYYGLHKTNNGWLFREWAPNATAIYLKGDFNDWQKSEDYRLQNIGNGNWERYFPENAIKHEQLYKLLMEWNGGYGERIPTHVKRVVQDENTKLFSAQVWNPIFYEWKNPQPKKIDNLLIYETHIGMSAEEGKVASYTEFKDKVLPHIVDTGYNVIQIMAIQEHPYYGSFGYQVSNFFAASSRFGTPEELKALVDEAHRYGIAVVLDVIHSHSVKNELEGLAKFDGTDTQFFYAGEQGNHPLWDSKCFDYGKSEVIAFLLSNLKFWMEEYKFDGFRFDGVTSMIYWHHGLGTAFSNYSMYFDGSQDENALTYLSLANQVVHEINPDAITIAEDVSGMPGLAAPFKDGGIGFDYRMSMGVADYWIKIIKELPDEKWNVSNMYYELTSKRSDERTVSYAECHDQAMVGDKTIIFRLADAEMYTSMSVLTPCLVVDRAIALHKMLRLLTMATAGNGYLTFMGNEFGHPEWIDFPRQGNNWSYHYARRQWHLANDPLLKYHFLLNFEKAMLKVEKEGRLFDYFPEKYHDHEADQVLAFKRGKMLFVFNFSPTHSYSDYSINVPAGKYKLILCGDDVSFGGFDRIAQKQEYFTDKVGNLKMYLPVRTAFVLREEK